MLSRILGTKGGTIIKGMAHGYPLRAKGNSVYNILALRVVCPALHRDFRRIERIHDTALKFRDTIEYSPTTEYRIQ